MHDLSRATAVALARRLGTALPDAPVEEMAEYVEQCRVRLALDNAAVTAAMLFAQPLLESWAPHWKFAYTVAVVLGTKLTTEGFYTADVVEHVTDEFSLDVLRDGEHVALEGFAFGDLAGRLRQFRNALVHVALQEPLPAHAAAAVQLPDGEHRRIPRLRADERALAKVRGLREFRAEALLLTSLAVLRVSSICLPGA